MMVRKTALSGLLAFLLILSLGLWATPASAYSLRWSGRPGNVTFSGPVVNMGVYSSTKDQLQILVNTISPSPVGGWQYAYVTLHAYYSCTTGWCNAGSKDFGPFGWFSSPISLRDQALAVPVWAGNYYYTYTAQTRWYNANQALVGSETYYPTATGTSKFTSGQSYVGNGDFACVGYAYSVSRCKPWGPAPASFSPTGQVYVLGAN